MRRGLRRCGGLYKSVAHEQPVFVKSTMEEQAAAKARKALPPIAARQRKVVAVDLGQRPANLFRQRQQAGELENLQAAMDVYTSIVPYANLEIIHTGEVSDAEKSRWSGRCNRRLRSLAIRRRKSCSA